MSDQSDDPGSSLGGLRASVLLASIVDSTDDAIISKNLDGTVTSWNRAAERMFGYSRADMIGTSIRRIIPADRQSEEDDVLARIKRGDKVDHFETIRQRQDGSMVAISLTVSPIRDESGTIVGASKIARDISDRHRAESERARLLALAERNAAITNQLNEVGTVVASALDREAVVQAVTDAATTLTDAQFGAFFYNVVDDKGESYTLYTISGVPRETFASFPMPRNTGVFDPTFRGVGVVRSDDITADPRYGRNAPHHGMPEGHLPVRSYLAVPVKGATGLVLGGLFFGHSDVGRFTGDHERLAVGIAAWASVALENARLYLAAQTANRLKDEFLATLSHELRTPLNAILGYSRMIRAGILKASKQPRAIEIIERNAESLTQIVEDVLDVSRIVAGKIRLHMQPVDVADVVRAALDAVEPGAIAKGLHIDVALDGSPILVSADPERLQQVIWNLLGNAVKFTDAGGRIDVRATHDSHRATITIADTGIGIPPDFLPHIFEAFRQADPGTTRQRGGLGLGLAIARQLVETHGGTIVAASEGTGKGTSFNVTFPLLLSTGKVSARRPRRDPPSNTPLKGTRVLVVDDDADALSMVRDILESAGATVASASSADEALTSITSALPDVIVSDLGMPQVDGFAFLASIRRHADPRVRSVPAVALTAYARSEDRARALAIGYQMHLAKPIDPASLLTAVAAVKKPVAPR